MFFRLCLLGVYVLLDFHFVGHYSKSFSTRGRLVRWGFSFAYRLASHSFIHSSTDSFNCNDNEHFWPLHCCRFSGKCYAVKRLSAGHVFPQPPPRSHPFPTCHMSLRHRHRHRHRHRPQLIHAHYTHIPNEGGAAASWQLCTFPLFSLGAFFFPFTRLTITLRFNHTVGKII